MTSENKKAINAKAVEAIRLREEAIKKLQNEIEQIKKNGKLEENQMTISDEKIDNPNVNEKPKNRRQESVANLPPVEIQQKGLQTLVSIENPKSRVYDEGDKGFLSTEQFKNALKEKGAPSDVLDALDTPGSPDFTYEDVH